MKLKPPSLSMPKFIHNYIMRLIDGEVSFRLDSVIYQIESKIEKKIVKKINDVEKSFNFTEGDKRNIANIQSNFKNLKDFVSNQFISKGDKIEIECRLNVIEDHLQNLSTDIKEMENKINV